MLNGSLCYLENPYKILDKIKSVKPHFILFTRTPFPQPNSSIFKFFFFKYFFKAFKIYHNFTLVLML